MASGSTSQMKSDNFRLFCALCLESYSSIRIPKILPCFHTFCLPCLRTLAEKTKSARLDDGENHEGKEEHEIDEDTDTKKSAVNETQTTNEVPQEKELEMPKEEQESENNTTSSDRISGEKNVTEAAHSLQCPTCRTTITLPEGGVSALQTNFYVVVDVESNTEEAGGDPVVCEMCEEGQQQEAQHFCHNCQQHMCRSCRRLHDLVGGARDHHVEALSYKSAPKLETSAKEKLLCQFHPDQSLCFNCCKCDTAICLHCKLTSHEGHETQDMATAVIQAKGELTGLRVQANKQLQSLEACISRLERDELDLKHQKQEVIHQVGSRYEILMTWAARARDEFLEELAAKEQATLNDIRTKKASACFLKGSISSRMARASRTVSQGADMVLMKNELQAALLSDESFEDFQKLADRKEHLAFFTCEAESSVLDLNIMRNYMGQLREADGSDRPSMTFHKLVSAVSSLETELKAVKGDSDCPSISSLEAELKAVKGDSDCPSISSLEAELKAVKGKFASISSLEAELKAVKRRFASISSLEAELKAVKGKFASISSLEAELKAVKGKSNCPSISSLETELKAVKGNNHHHGDDPPGEIINGEIKEESTDITEAEMEENDCQTEATFRYTVENISGLKETAVSPPCMGRYFSWKIEAGPRNSQYAYSQKSLGVYLHCNARSDSTSWSCQASVELRILNTKPDTEPFCRKISRLFNCNENNRGYHNFLSWNKLMDPEKGYVKDDKVTLEVHIMADAPHSVWEGSTVTDPFHVSVSTATQLIFESDKIYTTKISFHATVTRSSTYIGNGGCVIFNNILSNEGNGYSRANGYFTAPVAGTYVFTVLCLDVNGTIHNISINVNSTTWGAANTVLSNIGHCICNLKIGNRVSVTSQYGSGLYADASCFFSGALISM